MQQCMAGRFALAPHSVFIYIYNCLDAGEWKDQVGKTEAAVGSFACNITGLQLQKADFTER